MRAPIIARLRKRYNINSANRAKLPYNHKDPETQESLHFVDFFRESHFSKKSNKWISQEAESRYNRMKELRDKSTQDCESHIAEEEIAYTVLGSKSGYKRGYGVGPKPSSKKTSKTITNEEEVMSLKRELDGTKEKLQQIEKWQEMMMQQMTEIDDRL